MNTSKKLIITGIVSLAILNPLSINIIADVLVTAINVAMDYIVLASGYTMAVAGTLVAVGLFLAYDERNKSDTKRLKTVKGKGSKFIKTPIKR